MSDISCNLYLCDSTDPDRFEMLLHHLHLVCGEKSDRFEVDSISRCTVPMQVKGIEVEEKAVELIFTVLRSSPEQQTPEQLLAKLLPLHKRYCE